MTRKSPGPRTDQTILVVDDHEEALVLLRRLLEREGHGVLTAQSGERALALFKEHDIQLVLVDQCMPQMTGDQLVREIRKIDPFVQVIMQTGYSGEKPPRQMLAELDIQGYHDKVEGARRLLLWVQAAMKACRSIRSLRGRADQQGELVANVSHELRNPLNVISGYADLLLDGTFGGIPETARPPLHALVRTTRTLNDLVSNFLLYAKLEAGAIQVEREWVTLEQLGHEIHQQATFLLSDQAVCFSVDLEDAPAGLLTDAVKVRTILSNLINNAVKFTSSGTISLRIERGAADTVQFVVQDSGIGIPPEQQETIFEAYCQLDGCASRLHGGIGLGLTLSRMFARLLGGDLEVQSTSGVGSVFTLVLPTAEGSQTNPGAYFHRDSANRSPGDGTEHTTKVLREATGEPTITLSRDSQPWPT